GALRKARLRAREPSVELRSGEHPYRERHRVVEVPAELGALADVGALLAGFDRLVERVPPSGYHVPLEEEGRDEERVDHVVRDLCEVDVPTSGEIEGRTQVLPVR